MNNLLPIARMFIIILLKYRNREALSHDSINKVLSKQFSGMTKSLDKPYTRFFGGVISSFPPLNHISHTSVDGKILETNCTKVVFIKGLS